jgi:hypothetical protein
MIDSPGMASHAMRDVAEQLALPRPPRVPGEVRHDVRVHSHVLLRCGDAPVRRLPRYFWRWELVVDPEEARPERIVGHRHDLLRRDWCGPDIVLRPDGVMA